MTLDDLLPPFQKRIFVYLAESEPQTIREISKGVSADYSATHRAFKKLESKKMLQVVAQKTYNNNEYGRYWISEVGAYVALCEGVSAFKLLHRSLRFYPENQNLHCLLEISPILGIRGFDIACLAFLNKGKIEQSDINSVIVSQMQDKLSVDDAKRIFEVIKKYPSINEQFKIDMQKRSRNMKSLQCIFE